LQPVEDEAAQDHEIGRTGSHRDAFRPEGGDDRLARSAVADDADRLVDGDRAQIRRIEHRDLTARRRLREREGERLAWQLPVAWAAVDAGARHPGARRLRVAGSACKAARMASKDSAACA